MNNPFDALTTRRLMFRWIGWFVAANTGLLLLASLRHWQSAGCPAEWPARFFLVLGFVGNFFTIAVAAAVPVLLSIVAWPSRWLTGILAVLLFTVTTLLVILDSIVFHLFRFHLNGMVWSLVKQGNLKQELPLSSWTWFVACLLVLVVLGAEIGVARIAWRWVQKPRTRNAGLKLALGLLTVVLSMHMVHALADAKHYLPITRIPRSLPACRPLTARKTLQRLGIGSTLQEPSLRAWSGKSSLRYPTEPLGGKTPTQPLNILILVIDGWRFDMLNESVTPNLFAFSQRHLRFEQHSAAANATRFGIFTLFYGVYGTYWQAFLAEERGPVLISELRKSDYQFGIWGAAPLNSPEFDRTVFSELRRQLTLFLPGNSAPDRDKEITRRFKKFLDEREPGRPFFGFLFYDSTHAYDYPPDVAAPFQPVCPHVEHLSLASQDTVRIRNRYLNAAHFVDGLAAQALQRLEQEGLLDSTIVLITGDHGEEFNDTGRNYWGHNSNWSRYQTQVPLIMHWPGRPAAVYSHMTTHLDIAPTLLVSALGCTNALRTFTHGLDLFDPAPRMPFVIGNWNRFGVVTPSQIDEVLDTGEVNHYDQQWHEITAPIPAQAIPVAMEGMSRFFAR